MCIRGDWRALGATIGMDCEPRGATRSEEDPHTMARNEVLKGRVSGIMGEVVWGMAIQAGEATPYVGRKMM